ncbi:hypothetical protein TcWFU_001041 [Taenia crassiceps]|uniref:Uncharacterized protein n=1 Tax=Taenia crassiceps TaxID=6207 RepID=A0ABR4Q1G5_9CEST
MLKAISKPERGENSDGAFSNLTGDETGSLSGRPVDTILEGRKDEKLPLTTSSVQGSRQWRRSCFIMQYLD